LLRRRNPRPGAGLFRRSRAGFVARSEHALEGDALVRALRAADSRSTSDREDFSQNDRAMGDYGECPRSATCRRPVRAGARKIGAAIRGLHCPWAK